MARPLVALALELDFPARRHLDVLAGIHRWVDEHGTWDIRLDEKVAHEPARRLGRYVGVIARATPALAAAARKQGVPVVNVWQGSPVTSQLAGVFPDGASIGAVAADTLLLRGFSSFGVVNCSDQIVDAAGQKGTGRWTAIEAQHLAAPVPVIEAAVMARNVSALRDERAEGEAVYGAAARRVQVALADLEQALIAGKILCYAQGFAMMAAAGRDFGWALDMPGVARVWRAGCIIRSDMLNDMAEALADGPGRNLILAPGFAARLTDTLPALRRVVAAGALHGLALPALGAGLAWFDMMRTARGTANMIQGQRDFFGLHGFDRLDGRDLHHGPWARSSAGH